MTPQTGENLTTLCLGGFFFAFFLLFFLLSVSANSAGQVSPGFLDNLQVSNGRKSPRVGYNRAPLVNPTNLIFQVPISVT